MRFSVARFLRLHCKKSCRRYRESGCAHRRLVRLSRRFDERCAGHPDRFTEIAFKEAFLSQTKSARGFEVHPKIKRLFGIREEMATGKRRLDWGAAEALAFASLLADGINIRLSGQDSGRGTFSHRHSVLRDFNDGRTHEPLNYIASDQGRYEVIDSPLSEAGVLGFEFGYSLDMPDSLVIWEAQFGDFANGAQVIIDQFIASSEDKWSRLSGLVLLLPHGFEGQGPEHCSSRAISGMCRGHYAGL